jgi:hypothetical protein
MRHEPIGPRPTPFWVIALLLASCTQVVVPTPGTISPVDEAPPITASSAPTEVHCIPTPTPAVVHSPLPPGLVVAYIVPNELWVWTEGTARLILQREGIWGPRLSDDGEWVAFLEETRPPNAIALELAIWVVRTDGTELQRVMGPEDLAAFAQPDMDLSLDDFDWLPGRTELLFNTGHAVDGPPGSWPTFDLHLLDLSGQITRLAGPGNGGSYFPSPDGRYIAVASNSRIGLIDLEGTDHRTLLDFAPLLMGCECYYIPHVSWDPQSRFVLTSIPPANMNYPEEYNGEPEQVWRLSLDGSTQVIAQVAPVHPHNSVLRLAPDLHHFLYLAPAADTCDDASGLYVYDMAHPLVSAPAHCGWELPEWTPDSERFVLYLEGQWQLGNTHDGTTIPLAFLNVPTDPHIFAPPRITWIDDMYFMLTLGSSEDCSLSVATLEGIAAHIAVAEPDSCPSADFALSSGQ